MFYPVYFLLCLVLSVSALSNDKAQTEMLCADPDCSVPISFATAKVPYGRIDIHHMSFKKGEQMAILQKPLPEDKNGMWYACIIDTQDKKGLEIDIKKNCAKSGLVPSGLLREFKTVYKNHALIRVAADTGRKNISPLQPNETDSAVKENILEVDRIAGGVAAEAGNNGPPSTPYEVFDGTTLYEGLAGDSFVKSTAAQDIPHKSTPSVPLEPSKVVPSLATETVGIGGIDEVDDDDDEDEAEDGDEEDDGEEEVDDEEDLVPEIKDSQPIEIDPSTLNLIPKQGLYINPSPTMTSSEPSSNLETTENPRVVSPSDPAVVEDVVKRDPTSVNLINSFLDLETALNFEPGRSAENDELILKKFSSISPTMTQNDVFNSASNFPPPGTSEAANIPNSKDNAEALSNLEGPSEVRNETDQMDFQGGGVSEDESFQEAADPPTKQVIPDVDIDSIATKPKPFLPNQPEINETEQEAITKLLIDEGAVGNVEQDKANEEILPLDASDSIEPVTDVPVKGSGMPLTPDGMQEKPEEVPAAPSTINYDPQSSPISSDLSADNVSEVDPHNAETITNDVPSAPPYNIPVSPPPYLSGQIYPGLIPKEVVSTENYDKNDYKKSVEEQGTQIPEESLGSVQQPAKEEDVRIPGSIPPLSQQPFLPENEQVQDIPSPSHELPAQIPGDIPFSSQQPADPSGEKIMSIPPSKQEGLKVPEDIPLPYQQPTVQEDTPVPNDEFLVPQQPILNGFDSLTSEMTEKSVADNLIGKSVEENAVKSDIPLPNLIYDSIHKPTVEEIVHVQELTPQFPDRTTVEDDLPTPPSQFLGNILGVFSGIFGEESQSSDIEPVVASTNHFRENEAAPFGECKTVTGLEAECINEPSPPHLFDFFEKTVPSTSYSILYLIVTSITVLLFTLGYYLIERTRRDGPLIAKVNQLTHELQVATSQLQNKAFDTIDEQQSVAQSIEIAELKQAKIDLEAQMDALQQELDAATEAGLELNKMLSDLFAQQEGSGAVLKSVEQLQSQLNAQQVIIDNMNISLIEKSRENEVLQSELLVAQEKSETLEKDLSEMRENIDQLLADKESAIWELESKSTQLESDLVALAESKQRELANLTEIKTNEIKVLSATLEDVKKKLLKSESEFRALDATIKQLQGQSQVDVKAIYDVGLIKAELERTTSEKAALKERLEDEEGARKLLEDHVKKVDEEVAELRNSFQIAEKEKLAAETRLNVLSNYFKEKEAHLQKELGLQEAILAQKEGDDTTIYERMKSLSEEVESYNFDSFHYVNEGLSVTNSLSPLFNESPNSVPNLFNEDSEGNLFDGTDRPEKIALPLIPIPAVRSSSLKRRRSSATFEARLGCVEEMILPKPIESNALIPEDLLKLQEMKTVRASPFRDTSPSPEPRSEGSTTVEKSEEQPSGTFSKLIEKLKIGAPDQVSQTSYNSLIGHDEVKSSRINSISELVEIFEKSKKSETRPNSKNLLPNNPSIENNRVRSIFADYRCESNDETNYQSRDMTFKEAGVKCSKLIDIFEGLKKQGKNTNNITNDLTDQKYVTSNLDGSSEYNNFINKCETSPMFDEILKPLIGSNGSDEIPNFSKSPIPFESCSNNEKGIPYDLKNSDDFSGQPDEERSKVLQLNCDSSKSDSEDSQSVPKECSLSTATLAFDIKVVANASSSAKQFKKRSKRQNNGAQNEVLKKEIIDQERGLKGRIASLEKKAHENWVAARQAERRLEESKQEAGQLRNMITLIEKSNVTETDGKVTPRLAPGELNGDSLSPLLPEGMAPLPLPRLPLGFMPPFMPPPMDGFMPPPPPFLPGDHRPPPLGRMSSPPLNRYSPSSVDYSYDRLSSPPPLSPPVRDYRSPPADADRYPRSPLSPWKELSPRSSFRPVTSHRDAQKSYQGSNPSSVHSSSESLHKPTKKVEKYSKSGEHSRKN